MLSSYLFLSIINIPILKKTLIKKLAEDLLHMSITPNKQDIKVNFLINAIDIAITLIISKAKLFSKLISRFDKECKKLKIKAKKLK